MHNDLREANVLEIRLAGSHARMTLNDLLASDVEMRSADEVVSVLIWPVRKDVKLLST